MTFRMKSAIPIICCLIGSPEMACPQTAPSIEWQYNYGGSLTELARSVDTTTDGGYIAASTTISSDGDVTGHIGSVDIWVTKLRADGTMEWQRCYGGTASEFGVAMIKQTDDGGYILGGTTESTDGDVTCPVTASNMWVLKIDHLGAIQWQRCLGGSSLDNLAMVRPTMDGGFIVAGGTYSSDGDAIGHNGLMDRLLIKLSANGDTEWSRCYGGSWNDGASDVTLVSDGGFISCGFTQSNDGDIAGGNPYFTQPVTSQTGWILKVDHMGDIVWQQFIGGFSNDWLWRCLELNDGSFYLIGHTFSNDGHVSGNHGGNDGWIIRIDAHGELLGQRCFGGSSWDEFRDAALLSNGNVLVIGRTTSTDGDIIAPIGQSDIWVLEINPDLEIVWQKTYGGSNHELGSAIQAIIDGGAVFVGQSTSLDGDLTGNNGDIDLWVVKLAPWNVGIAEEASGPGFHLHPSPADAQITIQLVDGAFLPLRWMIMDALGRRVRAGTDHSDRWSVDVSALAPGAYLFYLESAQGAVVKRFVKW